MDTKKAALDLSRLLGFDALEETGSVDFRDDAVASRLGAKVGEAGPAPATVKAVALDRSRLLGFDAVEGTGRVDFRDDAIAARLGAKVGEFGHAPAPAPND